MLSLKILWMKQSADFNQAIVYGKDSDVIHIISQAKEYPMMAQRRLVVVREAQDLKKIEGI